LLFSLINEIQQAQNHALAPFSPGYMEADFEAATRVNWKERGRKALTFKVWRQSSHDSQQSKTQKSLRTFFGFGNLPASISSDRIILRKRHSDYFTRCSRLETLDGIRVYWRPFAVKTATL